MTMYKCASLHFPWVHGYHIFIFIFIFILLVLGLLCPYRLSSIGVQCPITWCWYFLAADLLAQVDPLSGQD